MDVSPGLFDVWATDVQPPIGSSVLSKDEISFVGAVRRLPKVELHIHVEGSLHFEHLRQWCVPGDLSSIAAARRFTNFEGFLKGWTRVVGLLDRKERFTAAAEAFVRGLSLSGVVWAEAFVSPPDVEAQSGGRVSFAKATRWWLEAFEEVSRPDVEVRLIVDFVRMYGPALAAARLSQLDLLRNSTGGHRLIGVGLGGPEAGYPLAPFGPVFERAREMGFLTVTHAGESVGAYDIAAALDIGVTRIGHAVSLASDRELIRRLVEAGVGVEFCPVSNLRTGVLSELAAYPLREWMDAGVRVAVGTDDPALMQTELALEFLCLRRAFGASLETVVALMRSAAEISSMNDAEMASFRARLAAQSGRS